MPHTQSTYRVVLYTYAQTQLAGFFPGVNAAGLVPTYDSGVVTSSISSLTIPAGTQLLDQTQYVVFVQVVDTAAATSAWASSAFETVFEGPSTPTLTAVPSTDPATGAPIMMLTTQGNNNLLSADDADFEASTGTWTPTTCTLAQDSTWSVNGNYSLKITPTTTSCSAQTAGGTLGYPCQGNYLYQIGAVLKAGSTGRSVTLFVDWYNSAGTKIGSDVVVETVTDSTSPTQLYGQITSPANAFTCSIGISIPTTASSEYHNLDEVFINAPSGGYSSIQYNTSNTYNAALFYGGSIWSRGGLISILKASFQYSDDGGITWQAVRNGYGVSVAAVNQSAIAYDYESPPGVARQYRAWMYATVSGQTLTSGYSATATNTVVLNNWWIKDLFTPANSMQISPQGSQQLTINEQATAYYTLGNKYPIVASDIVNGQDGSITVLTVTVADYNKILVLLNTQDTLLLQSPYGEQWYIRTTPARSQNLVPSSSDSPRRTTAISYYNVVQPVTP